MTFGSLGYMCLIHVLNSWAHLSSVPYMCLIFLKMTVPYMCLKQDPFFLSNVTIFHAKRLIFTKITLFFIKDSVFPRNSEVDEGEKVVKIKHMDRLYPTCA